MKQQVKTLVKVQEIDSLLAELSAGAVREPEWTPGASSGEAKRLRAERARIAASVNAELLQRYEQLRLRYPRAVVGTERGVCLGCFTKRPTAMSSREGGLETCERCGRILCRSEASAEPPRLERAEAAAATTAPARSARAKSAGPRSSPPRSRGTRAR
jgi:hypothetical protein